MKFNLGDTIKDTLTGVEGVVTQYIKHIYSQDRVSVQPAYNKKEMRMPARHHIDITSLEKIKDSELETLYQYKDSKEFNLGDTVSYPLQDVEGKIVQRALNVNGCYSLELGVIDGDGDPRAMWVEEKGIVLVKKVQDTPVKKADRKTGCLMTTIESEDIS